MTNDTNNNGGSTALAERPIQSQIQRRETRIVEDSGVLANLMDTARFEHLQRIATLMATMSLLPDHLKLDRDKRMLAPEAIRANCFRVTNQALRWGIDPFAMVDETYVVSGKLGYQGKLVAAVVNVRAGLKQRLSYRFEGTGENRSVIVSGTFEGEETPRESSLRYGDAKTSNQMWTKDPDQKLIYSGVVKWARRYCPEVVLGVLTDDDIDRMQQQAAAATAIGSRTLAQQFNESTAPVLEAPTFPGLKTEISEEEANRILEEKARQARAAQNVSSPDTGGEAESDQSPAGTGENSQVDPEVDQHEQQPAPEEIDFSDAVGWKESCLEAMAVHDITPSQAEKNWRVEMLKYGKVGKESEISADGRQRIYAAAVKGEGNLGKKK